MQDKDLSRGIKGSRSVHSSSSYALERIASAIAPNPGQIALPACRSQALQ